MYESRLQSDSGIVMWLDSPPQQQHLMTVASRDSSISPPMPQRLLVPVLQMLHDGPGPLFSPEWPAVTANARGLFDEFSCRFNYAAIHSVTHSVSQCVQGLQLEDSWEKMYTRATPGRKCNQSGLLLVWYVGLPISKTDFGLTVDVCSSIRSVCHTDDDGHLSQTCFHFAG